MQAICTSLQTDNNASTSSLKSSAYKLHNNDKSNDRNISLPKPTLTISQGYKPTCTVLIAIFTVQALLSAVYAMALSLHRMVTLPMTLGHP